MSYVRTAIRRLAVQGYRSVRAIELSDIPNLVVLHGPNGAGKSNILLAAQLLLRAAAATNVLPLGVTAAVSMPLQAANQSLGLRVDDFHRGASPQIRIGLTVELGARAAAIAEVERPLSTLELEVTFQLVGSNELRYWFSQANIDKTSLIDGTESRSQGVKSTLHGRRRSLESIVAGRSNIESAVLKLAPDSPAGQRESFQAQAQELWNSERALRLEIANLEKQLAADDFVAERVLRVFLPRMLQISPAYRVPGGIHDPEMALFRAFLSEDQLERDSTVRLSNRLARAGLFGGAKDVSIHPINSAMFGEQQVRFRHPVHGDFSVRNLGSGEQQVIYMLAHRVITPFPISHLEEPEAHLHPNLMASFAKMLHESVEGGEPPDTDQLWIATHHHHFALALEYFDVRVEDGSTAVRRLPRAMAAPHFYEPGPIWEALRQLASSAKESDTVVFRGPGGESVTAGQVLESIEKDPEQRIARKYADAMTEAMVLAMRRKAMP